MSTTEIDPWLDSPSIPLANQPARHELTSTVEALSRFPAEVSHTVQRAAVTRVDGTMGPLEQRLAETTAALKCARQARDECAREIARLNQQISTLRSARKHAEKLAGRDTSSPPKSWLTIAVVVGVPAAIAGIIAARSVQLAPQERSRQAKQSTVAASSPLVPDHPLGHAILPVPTAPATVTPLRQTLSPNNASSASTRIEPAPRRVAKSSKRPRTQPSANSSRGNVKSQLLGFTGALQVRSIPGSAVFLDRKYVGETPVQLTAVRAGSHVVWIQRDGYQRWTASVLVSADKQTQVLATLQPERGDVAALPRR